VRSSPLVLAAWLIAAALCSTSPVAAQEIRSLVDDSHWHLFAVEYAHSTGVAESRLVEGADASARVDMGWYFFVAAGTGRLVLIDCGTDAFVSRPALRRSWSVDRAITVVEALARLGAGPSDVTDIVLTHHHWDHVGGLPSFPGAEVHAHRGEWGRVPERLRRRRTSRGRIHTFSTPSQELWPGLRVRVSGAHTRHQLMVELRCADRLLVVASDAAYRYRNIEEGLPVAVTGDAERNVADVARAVRSAGAGNVLPGHDPALFERYGSSVEGVAAVCP